MSTLIISGGRVEIKSAAEYLKNRIYQHIIAVDGGLVAAQQLGLKPDYIVGDFDTLAPEALKPYENMPGVQIRRFVPEKDDTDTQIAVELAISLEQKEAEAFHDTEVTVLGAIGSRMDHTLANVCLLQHFMHAGIAAYAVDANNRISVHEKGFRLKKSLAYGPFLSFIAMTSEVTGLTLSGMKYPLERYTLKQDSSLCISNEYAAEDAYVSFESGILLMIEAKDE